MCDMQGRVKLGALLLALVAAAPAEARGFRRRPLELLPPRITSTPDEFGGTVAALDDTILVGAVITSCGGGFLFDAGTGVLIRELRDCVAFWHNLAAGGRWFAAPGLGGVHLFDRDGQLVRVLAVPDLERQDDGFFGTSVALNDFVAVVGGGRLGVYVFNVITGEVRFRIERSGAGPAGFGAAVALAGGWIVVADPAAEVVSGFEISRFPMLPGVRWSAKVRPGEGYGITLAGDGHRVAAAGVDTKGRETVFVLDVRTGRVKQRYRSPRQNAQFGLALALRGRRLLVGAPRVDVDDGRAYLYRVGRKPRIATFRWGARCGHSVALSGDWVVVGAPRSDDVAIFTR
jgi:hypothetical protein